MPEDKHIKVAREITELFEREFGGLMYEDLKQVAKLIDPGLCLLRTDV
ncbi:MAG: hypothetical protein U5R49_06460 [Deltaproteobacteria bacterium]|nr:hypothetical protein [Deltaproteobacteria bacterium]